MNVVIPRTIEAAKQALDGINGLLTAKEWERAAIVYAFTKPGTGGPSTGTRSGRLSMTAFAELGISGLRRKDTVSNYHKVWADAMQDGAAEAKPGKTVTLPTRKFPDNPDSPAGTVRSFRAAIKRDPKVLTEVMRSGADEDVEAVTEAMAEVQTDPLIREKVEAKVEAKTTTPRHTKAPGTDWSKVARAVVSAHGRADDEMRDLIQNLAGNPIYPSQIEEVIAHLEHDLMTDLPRWLVSLRALLPNAEQPTPRLVKDVTPAKEMA